MNFLCEILGETELAIDHIRNVGQIYRFDEARVIVEDRGVRVQFDIPTAEWLERFTDVLRATGPQEFRETLRESGWLFHVSRSERGVSLHVFDVGQQRSASVSLDFEQAADLHGVILDCLIRPFVAQGGRVNDLEDMGRYAF
jgi:hypothetical protein